MDRTANVILRIGAAFAFLYPPIDALFNADSWVGYFPRFLLASGIPPMVLLQGFGVVEIILALWILSGWKIFWPSLVAAAMLVAIVAFNFSQLEILFRDLSIAAAALALAADAYAKRSV